MMEGTPVGAARRGCRCVARGARAAVLLMAMLLTPAAAHAHAQLHAASPAAGAVIEEPPATVVLTFNEPVAPLSAVWTTPDGASLAIEAVADGARLLVVPPDDLPRGTQVLSWRVVSADGHPVAGAHVFSIGLITASDDIAASTAGLPALPGRAALTLTLAFGLGAVAFARTAGLRPGRLTVVLASAMVPSALLLLAGQAVDLAGAGPEALADPAAWGLLRQSPFLLTAGTALAAVALLLVRRQLAGWAALCLGGLSFALSGHAGTAASWALPVVALHGAALLWWAGALVVLPGTLRAGLDTLDGFSARAPAMIALLVGSGTALAWLQLELPLRGAAVLVETGYGRLLLAKLALVALLLGLAARNRWQLLPELAARGTTGPLVTAIRLEIALVAIILVLTAGFRLTPPPRALEPPALVLHVHGARSGADIRLIPGRPGANRVELRPHAADFGSLEPQELELAFTLAEQGLGPITVPAYPVAQGLWLAEGITLPAAGDWDLILRVLIDDFTQERLGVVVPLEGW